MIEKCRIISHGSNNKIIVSKGCRLKNCSISILGNSNTVELGGFIRAKDLGISIEDDGNHVVIGEHTTFAGSVRLAAIEGTEITIGKDCMFSANILIRTGDSHSVLDTAGRRTNWSRDIILGNHIWIGNTVIITKGVSIQDDSIVGAGSVVTRCFEESNVAIAGNPGDVIKRNVSWMRERIPETENRDCNHEE